MDWIEGKNRTWESLKKFRYAALILLAGIFLMALPQPKEERHETVEAVEQTPPDLQESLADILSQVQGAGKVKVLLTQAKGEQVLYQTDGTTSDLEERRNTVLITNAQREETGLIRQVNPPTYQGAIVICQGADNASVRLLLVEAVMRVTGLTSDHISVLKMK